MNKPQGAQVDSDERDEEEEFRQEGEEAQESMRRKPTEEELRVYRVSRLPFRGWCPACVAGRAKDGPHRARNNQETLAVPEVHWDHCFISEAAGEDYSVVLVGRFRHMMCLSRVVTPSG